MAYSIYIPHNWNLLVLMTSIKGDVDKQKSRTAFVFILNNTPYELVHKEANLCGLVVYKVQILNLGWGNKGSNMDWTILQGTWFCQTRTYGYLLCQSKFDKNFT